LLSLQTFCPVLLLGCGDVVLFVIVEHWTLPMFDGVPSFGHCRGGS
jgi:hypothetical protein